MIDDAGIAQSLDVLFGLSFVTNDSFSLFTIASRMALRKGEKSTGAGV